MRSDTEKPYDPAEDPDTEPATTPDEVQRDSERDQAEGDEPAAADD
jgi:hypothetical protein